jgi:cytochrome P450
MSALSRPKLEDTSSPNRAWAGVRGHWLTGCLQQLKNEPLETYQRAWRECGGFVRFRVVPGYFMYMMVHPDAIKHILVGNHGNYRKPALITGPLGELAGKGLVTSEGALWRRQRKLAQPAFHRERIVGLGLLTSRAVEGMLGEWKRFSQGRQFDIRGACCT